MCDAAMPGNNIAFAARELRELGYRGFLVCITDNFGPENIQNYIDHGANKVLDYPFSVRGILECQDGTYTPYTQLPRKICFIKKNFCFHPCSSSFIIYFPVTLPRHAEMKDFVTAMYTTNHKDFAVGSCVSRASSLDKNWEKRQEEK